MRITKRQLATPYSQVSGGWSGSRATSPFHHFGNLTRQSKNNAEEPTTENQLREVICSSSQGYNQSPLTHAVASRFETVSDKLEHGRQPLRQYPTQQLGTPVLRTPRLLEGRPVRMHVRPWQALEASVAAGSLDVLDVDPVLAAIGGCLHSD